VSAGEDNASEPAATSADPPSPPPESPAPADAGGPPSEPSATASGEPKARRHLGRRIGRRIASALLIFLGSILAPLAVIAVWTKATITNTDQFVTTMAPLASDPHVQAAVTNRVTNQITSKIDVKGIVESALPPRAERLAAPIESAFEGFVHATVSKVVTSPAFEKIWTASIRASHRDAVALLTGTGNRSVSVQGNELTVDLSQLVSNVKDRLVANGVTAAERIPTNAVPDKKVPLIELKNIQKAQAGFSLLNTIGFWMPVIVLILLTGGVLLSRRRRPAIIRCAIYVAIGMIVLLLLLSGARAYVLHEVQAKDLSSPAAASTYDIIIRFLRQSTKAVLTLSILVAAAVIVTGPGARATAIRHAVARLFARIGAWFERMGVLPRGLRDWFRRFCWVLYIAVIVLYFVLLVLWSWPTGLVEFLLALAALALLAIIGIVRSRTPEDLAAIGAGPGGNDEPPSLAAGDGPEPVGAGSAGA
jgi:hypothetical protein